MATFLALFGLLVVATALLVLMALVYPGFLGILLVVYGFGIMMLFHYLVWGWWLSRAVKDEEQEPKP